MFLTKLPFFFITTISIIFSLNPVSPTTEFVFNTNFNSTNLLLFGNATIQSSILSLTYDSITFSMGRALYPLKIPTKPTNSSSSTGLLPFSTSFIFSVAPAEHLLPGHGFAFLFVPLPGMNGTSPAQHLGLFNFTNDGKSNNHVFAVEFDVFENQEFKDIDDNHVGLNVNSLTSVASHTAGYWDGAEEFKELEIVSGVNYQVWIEFLDSRINVTMAPAGSRKPKRPLISEVVDLSSVLLDEMYVGFTGATGQLVESHRILAWSFSNTNFSIGDALVTQNLPSFVVSKGSVFGSKGFIAGVCLAGIFLLVGSGLLVVWFVVLRRKGKKKEDEEIEDWELEYWPHRIDNQEIYAATEGFSEKNVIGFGGNGKVYKGVLAGGIEVAVKRISLQNEDGMREFLAEISSLGRLKHRNLVGLRGWCKSEKRSMVLVYDYMENGSLDKRIFECKESVMLSWEQRIKVLKNVACGVLYLHEGWEAKVLHRDIKASNVLLDKDMNARLGDFGLARMHHHGTLSSTTTRVVGTVGYMAPEVVQTGRTSVQTDVYGFGVLVLEVVCGRRPIEEGKPSLVDWLWRLMERGELVSALDERLKTRGGYSMEEVERVLYLGLLCVNPEAQGRPTMREVVKVLEMKADAAETSEDEGMEVNLLEKMKTTAMFSKFGINFGGRGHPTIEEIRQSHSSSISLGNSDIIREGR
ncbi:probable L-type lectin-domain containing receptor kinase VII.2 [Ziziphus jujuba]|uniref:Probable L-type lectin-domain containing receptor kinase VII.2 n=1 Tax=Ziziphus jujuba TaxID=326968 RepID=A0A6P4BP93_ZIZJJ|nr:probable L-type lectin-domain containing receptor kinase VII.2 [Ziziphus jujuba]